ncbi:type I CRISPR-associated protein Cas8a1/Csx8 [Eubacterium multiforme]|uniref:CRISPR-associated protein Cst1 n=1 Tax=Eubacterium multiforme TaxID=83339 RepID=A0ABT9USV1_9FIRM|nr:type I CRISPR-associated protein Cas8a1/Csx8 [Eubacterium multiforme]MDQ0149369.1 CRISPR-associated protein Cst1 [Eubacterium multiforme]
MKNIINEDKFDYSIEASDWRYSAAIVGLIKYFDYLHGKGIEDKENLYQIDDDILKYNSKAITEENYLLFVEKTFSKEMHHLSIESILANDEITEEQEKLINEKLKANKPMQNVFNKIKYSEENKEVILDLINKNRLELIKRTYEKGLKLYKKFNNENSLFSKEGKSCRILNYYVDMAKKGKSLGYFWDITTFSYQDDEVFDFIPFAFSKSYEAFFINNNYSIKELLKSNSLIENSEHPRDTLFSELKNSSEYIDFDVEVIIKNQGEAYYKTLFLRKETIEILKKIENYNGIKVVYKDKNPKSPDYLENDIIDCILNKIKLDSIIEMLLKSTKYNYSYNIKTLIDINKLIYGGDIMNQKMKGAFAAAKSVNKGLEANKINSYKQKLISSITFKNYDRFCEILLQLSSYSGIVFNFAYDLFDDFEENKNLAYTFINALGNNESNKEGGENNE